MARENNFTVDSRSNGIHFSGDVRVGGKIIDDSGNDQKEAATNLTSQIKIGEKIVASQGLSLEHSQMLEQAIAQGLPITITFDSSLSSWIQSKQQLIDFVQKAEAAGYVFEGNQLDNSGESTFVTISLTPGKTVSTEAPATPQVELNSHDQKSVNDASNVVSTLITRLNTELAADSSKLSVGPFSEALLTIAFNLMRAGNPKVQNELGRLAHQLQQEFYSAGISKRTQMNSGVSRDAEKINELTSKLSNLQLELQKFKKE